MKMSKNARFAASVAVNVLTAVFVTYAVASYFFFPDGTGVVGATCFRYFTIDSNILCALSALTLAVFRVLSVCRGTPVPRFAVVFKYVGTVAVTVTFLTVVLFLGPTQGYGPMFSGAGLWLHLICPLLALGSFWLCDGGEPLHGIARLLGLVPTAVYGVLYLTMVVIVGAERGGWQDFYGFNIGGLWEISFVAMVLLTLGICFGVAAVHSVANQKGESYENR